MPFDTTNMPQFVRDIGGWTGGNELSPNKFLPYYDHVADDVVALKDNRLMAMLRIEPIEFYLSNNAKRNGNRRRHFALLQLLAGPDVEIYEHHVCHANVPAFQRAPGGSDYWQEFYQRYQSRVLRGLKQYDWFITVIVKPRKMLGGNGGGWFAKLRGKGNAPAVDDFALAALNAKVRTIMAALRGQNPQRLGTERRNGMLFSEVGKALCLIATTRTMEVPYASPIGNLSHAVYRERVVHGSRGFIVERGGGRTNATVGRMYGLNVYPKNPRVGMFDDLVSDMQSIHGARWVMMNYIHPLNRAQASERLTVLRNKLEKNVGHGATDIADIEDALDDLAGSQEVRGNHAFTLAVHADSMPELDAYGAAISDIIAGAGCSPTAAGGVSKSMYWLQYPGNIKFNPAPAVIGMNRFTELSGLEGHPTTTRPASERHKKIRWGHAALRYVNAGGGYYDHELFDGGIPHTIYIGPSGSGKCLARGTPIMMYTGKIKPVENVVVGDFLMGPDSQPRLVTSLARGREEMFKITPKKGDPYTVNKSHILSLKMGKGSKQSCGRYEDEEIVNLTVDEFNNETLTFRNYAKGWRAAVNFPAFEGEVPLDSYLLGVWLGDGACASPKITTPDFEIKNYIENWAKNNDVNLRFDKGHNCMEISLTGGGVNENNTRYYKKNKFIAALQSVGLMPDKFIPDRYKYGSRQERLEILAGILDTDGYLSTNTYDIVLKHEKLMDDLIFVARSLGFAAYKKSCKKQCTNNGVWGDYFRCTISGDIKIIPCKIPRRKISPDHKPHKDVLTGGIKAESVGEGDYFGFTLDGSDRLFLLGDFTVTHNTLAVGVDITAATALIGSKGTIVTLDKDRSNKLTILNNAGTYVELKRGEESGAAPLRRMTSSHQDRNVLCDLIFAMIMRDGGPPISERAKAKIAQGVSFVMRQKPERRELGTIHAFIPPNKHDPSDAANRFKPWCRGERLGWAFDGTFDGLDFNQRLAGVDYTQLLDDPNVWSIMAGYLFYLAKKTMDGRRFIFVVEELQFLLESEECVKHFMDFLLTGRKNNVAFWALIQQPESLLSHKIGPAILSQCRTRKLFKNELANREAYCGGGKYGDGLHATPQEYKAVIQGMTVGTWSFLLQRPGKSVLVRFDLGSLSEDIAVLSGTPSAVAHWDKLSEQRRHFYETLPEV